MQKGWKAAGLLEPVYEKAGGRDALAEKAGVSIAHLSGVNSGKRDLGITVARKIANSVPGVTVLDLGAPEEAAIEEEHLLLADLRNRLAITEDEVQWLTDLTTRLARVAKVKLPPRAQRSTAQADGASQ